MDRDSEVAHIGGQLGFRLGVTQLGQDVVNIRVGLEIEVDKHPHQAVVGVDRIHVVHVVHAAHLLFDGSGHGLLDGLRVGADVVRLNEDFRGHHLGKLRDGQREHRDQPDDDHDDGNHHGDDGAVDEEFGHGLAAGRRLGRLRWSPAQNLSGSPASRHEFFGGPRPRRAGPAPGRAQ